MKVWVNTGFLDFLGKNTDLIPRNSGFLIHYYVKKKSNKSMIFGKKSFDLNKKNRLI